LLVLVLLLSLLFLLLLLLLLQECTPLTIVAAMILIGIV